MCGWLVKICLKFGEIRLDGTGVFRRGYGLMFSGKIYFFSICVKLMISCNCRFDFVGCRFLTWMADIVTR